MSKEYSAEEHRLFSLPRVDAYKYILRILTGEVDDKYRNEFAKLVVSLPSVIGFYCSPKVAKAVNNYLRYKYGLASDGVKVNAEWRNDFTNLDKFMTVIKKMAEYCILSYVELPKKYKEIVDAMCSELEIDERILLEKQGGN